MKSYYLDSTKKRRIHRVRMKLRAKKGIRLSVFRSNRYIYAQIIDDKNHRTLACSSSIEKDFDLISKNSCEAAQKVGKVIAQRALKSGINRVVFDRGGYKFHGRVKALAQAARDEGLSF